jgi:hypothetical protein
MDLATPTAQLSRYTQTVDENRDAVKRIPSRSDVFILNNFTHHDNDLRRKTQKHDMTSMHRG